VTAPTSPPPGSLVLLRHGETEWSRSGRHTGLTDLPLTEKGVADARRLATLLEGHRFALVLSSPLTRAWRTAELAGLPRPVAEERLVEWDYGGYEGLTSKQIRERLGRPWSVFNDGVVPGETPGETIEQVAARVGAVLEERVLPAMRRGDVAVVGHGHCLRVLAGVYLRQEPRLGAHLKLDAASVSVLGHERETRAVERWNRTPDR
jgi:broad specificity phosphatase PhoE